jgi:beta-mannosidase
MPLLTISLNDNLWTFGQVSRCLVDAANVNDMAHVTEWLPATVPGNVRTDLLALNRIPDPFWAEDHKKSLWVEDVDWWYRHPIEVDQLAPAHRTYLVFEGIDYLSAIFVNGQEMARHEGMFSRQIIEVTHALFPGANEIGVRLWGSGALPKRKLNAWQQIWQAIARPFGGWIGIYPDRTATLKCQMSFGWDFAPPIRTMGIWDDVSLVTSGSVFITGASVVGQPVNPQNLPPEATHAPAQMSVTLDVDADQVCPISLEIRLAPANFLGETIGPLNFALDLPAGHSTQKVEFELADATLWQPWDRGQSCLYYGQIKINTPDGSPLAEVIVRTGVRSITLNQWQFTVNGQPEFIRGVNWVPADSFPGRVQPEKYRQLLTQAKENGANLLRVWGGGLREKKAFYDLCDELGLLVWQEFPFACMFLGSFPRDDAYLNKVESECSAIVRQLRHHPSVAVWCGGNEFSQKRNQPLLQTLASIVSQFDPIRPFIPVSPSLGQGDNHHSWDVWHGDEPIGAYGRETARFVSEFGLQSLPHADTLKTSLADPTRGWETHHADLPKLRRYNLPFVMAQMADAQNFRIKFFDFSRPADIEPAQFLETNITASQRAQAAALQTAIEHMRRRKGEAGGVCLWQFNEPWPAISWAIVDYFGRPKLAYKQLANWYNPVLVSLKFPVGHRWHREEILRLEVWGINDSLQNLTGCNLQLNLDGKVIHRQTIALPANSINKIGTLTQKLTGPVETLSLTLHDQDQLLAQNSYDLSWEDEFEGNFSRRMRRRMADWILR